MALITYVCIPDMNAQGFPTRPEPTVDQWTSLWFKVLPNLNTTQRELNKSWLSFKHDKIIFQFSPQSRKFALLQYYFETFDFESHVLQQETLMDFFCKFLVEKYV